MWFRKLLFVIRSVPGTYKPNTHLIRTTIQEHLKSHSLRKSSTYFDGSLHPVQAFSTLDTSVQKMQNLGHQVPSEKIFKGTWRNSPKEKPQMCKILARISYSYLLVIVIVVEFMQRMFKLAETSFLLMSANPSTRFCSSARPLGFTVLYNSMHLHPKQLGLIYGCMRFFLWIKVPLDAVCEHPYFRSLFKKGMIFITPV